MCFMFYALPDGITEWLKTPISVYKVLGLFLGPVESDAASPTPIQGFFLSCVAQALSRGDGPRHSLHALA